MFSDLHQRLAELPDQALDDRIREIALERRRLDAEFSAAVAVAGHRQLGAVDGHRTINSYLRATLNCSSTEASRIRSQARAVTGLRRQAALSNAGAAQNADSSAVPNRRIVDSSAPGGLESTLRRFRTTSTGSARIERNH